jgi:hypothetical protein
MINYYNIIIILLFLYVYHHRNYKWYLCSEINQNKLVISFNKYGLIIIPNMVSNKECDEILNLIEIEKKYKSESRKVRSPYKRTDLIIPVEKCKKYIKNIHNKLKYFFDKITPNAKLMECSSFITEPGCYPQSWHSDTHLDKINATEESKYANFISVAISLHDIEDEHGPIEALLGTHKLNQNEIEMKLKEYRIIDKFDDMYYDKSCEYYYDDIKRGLCEKHGLIVLNDIEKKYKKVKGISKKGSITIWSSKIFHRGGQNYGKNDRNIFYFSVLGDNRLNPIDYKLSIEKNHRLNNIYIKDL